MPDIFVPEDTTGYTSYYLEATNRGLINEFAQQMADSYRSMMRGQKTMEQLERVLPRDNTLLQAFVGYAANHGLPARWYYINQSRSLLLNQIKAVIARDLIGYQGMIRILNTSDKTVLKAIEKLQRGESPVNIPKHK